MNRTNPAADLKLLDHILSGASSAVAVAAACLSLGSDHNAAFFGTLVLFGSAVSALLVASVARTRLLQADTTVYTVAALVSAIFIATLNTWVPDPVYEGNLTMSGVLCWMLALGSFAIWRDQTMLFQAVPGIALFGLVGCYDTFRASVVYFFAFLVCQAILLARAHGRAMFRQAISSHNDMLEFAAMRRGPWRWMAGPEWALASAVTIVLISAVGAPILRESASSFSGLVRYTPPLAPLAAPSTVAPSPTGVRVGTGPNVVRNTPVLRVKIPEPLYLRGFVYGAYDRGSWLPRSPFSATNSGETPLGVAKAAIEGKREISFRVEPLGPTDIVPYPGELESMTPEAAGTYRRNPGGAFNFAGLGSPPLEGTSIVSDGAAQLTDADRHITDLVPSYGNPGGIPVDVAQLATEVTKSAKTDYDRALAIEREIERRALYNLNAAATPSGADPVSYFLFASKQGYCDLFASSMTLMARSVGLPARYVTGYYPFDESPDSDGSYVVRAKHAHAWCEIFFKRRGWVVFDATEGAQSVDGGELGSVNDRPLWMRPWVITFGLLIFVGAGGYFGLRRLRSHLAFRRSPAFAEYLQQRIRDRVGRRIAREYRGFEGEVRRALRRPRATGETMSEYVTAAREPLQSQYPAASAAVMSFSQALYADGSVDEACIDDLKAKVRAVKQARGHR